MSVADVSSLSQYGITWYFDSTYESGQFVNGDYWVLGPVIIDSVTPSFDGEGNGSTLDPVPRKHGYDTRGMYYEESERAVFPLTVSGVSSLVSTISQNDTRPMLEVAAVLTILDTVPASDAFRPPYCDGIKPMYRYSGIMHTLVKSFAAPPDNLETRRGTYTIEQHLPDSRELAAATRKVWLDHHQAYGGRYRQTRPYNNMPTYARESADLYGTAVSLLLTNTNQDYDSLLIHVLQIGIDYYGVALQDSCLWQASDGQGSGRKYAIVATGVFFDNDSMKSIDCCSQEEQQTYYYNDSILPEVDYWGFPKRGVPCWSGPKVLFGNLWYRDGQWCRDYEHVQPENWSVIRPGTDLGGCRSENYRRSSSSICYVAQALTMHMMDATQYWDPAFLDYVDRWMVETYNEDELEKLKDIHCDTSDPDDIRTYSIDPNQRTSTVYFVDALWNEYRAPVSTSCGDGVCQEPVENEITCPDDCGNSSYKEPDVYRNGSKTIEDSFVYYRKKNYVHIHKNGFSSGLLPEISFFTMRGRIIESVQTDRREGWLTFKLSGIPANGVYIVSITDNDNQGNYAFCFGPR